MTKTDDPLTLVAGLEPAMLDRLADEGYTRRRHADLARTLATARGPAPAGGRRPSRGPRRRWRARLLGVAATGAAGALAIGVLVAVSGGAHHGGAHDGTSAAHHATRLPAIRLTSAQRELYRLAATAAARPGLTGRYVELRLLQITPAHIPTPAHFRSLFPHGKVPAALQMDYRRLVKLYKQQEKLGPVLTIRRTTVVDSRTGNTWTYQQGPGVPRELPEARHLSPTAAQLAAWPTQTAALRAVMITEAHKMPQGRGETSDDLVFQQASDWLCNPLISPALRSALYKVLAATPGVVVRTGVRDSRGRAAIEITRSDQAARQTFSTFEDPATGAVLESLLTGDGPGRNVYLSIASTATLPANPYRAS